MLGVTADGGYDLLEVAGTPGPAGEYQQRYYAPGNAPVKAGTPGRAPRLLIADEWLTPVE